MAIGNIKRKWLRRAVVIIVAPVAFVAHILVGLAQGCVDAAEDVRSAW